MYGLGKAVVSFIVLAVLLKLSSCQGDCNSKFTDWTNAGGGDTALLYQHIMDCGGDNNVLQSFLVESSGENIRYIYTCCRFANNNNICNLRQKADGLAETGKENIPYLDRTPVSCYDGALNKLKLVRNGGQDHWRYEYVCCNYNPLYKSRSNCYTNGYNGYADYYWDRPEIGCDGRYFLRGLSFNLYLNQNKLQYSIKCCAII